MENKSRKGPFLLAHVISDLIDNVISCIEHELEPADSIDYELLKAALRRNDQGVVKCLMSYDSCRAVNPNKTDSAEETPLHLAVKNGHSYTDYDIVSKLMDKGASVYDKNFKGETPLLAAFNKGYLQAVKTMLKKCNSNFNPINADDVLHFHIACVTNEYDSAEKYLKCGIEPNSPLDLCSSHCRRLHSVQRSSFEKKTCDYGGLNPMQFAIEKQYFDLFLRLVKYNGDLSLINAKGLTPLQMIYYSKLENSKKYWFQNAFKHGNDKKFINSEDEYGVSHFHLCCIIDEPDFVQIFIDNGANVNKSVSSTCPLNPGFTPLHFAVNYGCEKVVKLLLRNGADPNKLDECGKAPLHLAFKIDGNLKKNIVKILLEYKAIPDIADNNGCTPLHEAFYYEDCVDLQTFEIIMSKIQWGTDNYTNEEGLSFFHIACTTNNVNQVIKFLNSGVYVNSCISSGNYRGFTALHFAVMYNQKDVVKVLLKRNAKVNVRAGGTGVTPLHLACEFNYMKFDREEYVAQVQGSCWIVTNYYQISLNLTSSHANQLEIIQLLLSHGSDVNAIDTSTNNSPLFYACLIHRNYSNLHWKYLAYSCSRDTDIWIKEIGIRLEKIVKILISNKATFNVENQRTILHIISGYRTLKVSEKFMKFIVDSGVDVNAAADNNETALYIAVVYSNKMLVTRLLKHKANPNIEVGYFGVPLLAAIKRITSNDDKEIQKDIFCALLENGSDVNMRLTHKQPFLFMGIRSYNCFIIEKLLYYGADINAKSYKDGTPCILLAMMEWERGEEWLNNHKKNKVFQIIFIHVQKLLALGLPVDDKIQKFCAQLYPHYKSKYERAEGYSNLDNIFDNCIKELDKMKNVKISCHTSLYDILLKNPHELAKYANNNNLIEMLKVQNVDRKFPLYGYLLRIQFKKGLARSEVLQSSEASLSYLLNIKLPLVCCDLILKYLKDEEIVSLKKVPTLQKKETGQRIMRLRLTRLDELCVFKPVRKHSRKAERIYFV